MEKIIIGKIVNSVGLKGEVKVYNYSDYKERYEEIIEILIDDKKYEIEKVRYQKEMVILKIKNINDRNTSDTFKNKEIYITEKDLKELPSDTYYIRDLIGLKVIDEKTQKELGVIKDVIKNTAQDIYVVAVPGKNDALIPVVKEFIGDISLEQGIVNVNLIEGIIE